jgi:hypothetical protein
MQESSGNHQAWGRNQVYSVEVQLNKLQASLANHLVWANRMPLRQVTKIIQQIRSQAT